VVIVVEEAVVEEEVEEQQQQENELLEYVQAKSPEPEKRVYSLRSKR
jgi:hypothetical protein